MIGAVCGGGGGGGRNCFCSVLRLVVGPLWEDFFRYEFKAV